MALCQADNRTALLTQLSINPDDLSKKSLSSGLMLKDTANKPAWLRGLRHSNKQLRDRSQNLIEQYKINNPNTCVVIIDEINSPPMMEGLLNSLLMGKRPLKEGETADQANPDKPGFFAIGTQNPPTMAGRKKPSTALARRMISAQLPEYTCQEMVTILMDKSLPEQVATALANTYQEQLTYARQNHLSPEPV